MTATAAASETDEIKETRSTARTRFSDLQLSTLDTVFVSSKGIPEQSVMQRTAKALKLDDKQVSVWFNNQRRREKQGAYRPGQFGGVDAGNKDAGGANAPQKQ
ncbi:uncharacterized protein LOC114964398 [Acropora millepora]|nr:uncharacterized protein LOC114964398 [Acropora millepora]